MPLFSFLLIGGKCRYCHTSLSWYYPLSELGTGILFLLTFLTLGSTASPLSILYSLFIISCLIVVLLMDAKYGLIPFVIVLPASVVSILYLLFFTPSELLNNLLSGLGSFFFLFLFYAGTKGRGMGFGDVVYAGFMGLLLGFPGIILAHYTAFLTGALISSILILLKRKKLKGSTIPFGPFLVLGTFITLFWGKQIIEMVSKYLHIS